MVSDLKFNQSLLETAVLKLQEVASSFNNIPLLVSVPESWTARPSVVLLADLGVCQEMLTGRSASPWSSSILYSIALL